MVQYGYGLLLRLPDNHLSGIVQNCKRALEGRSEEEAFFSFFLQCRHGCWGMGGGFSKTADAPENSSSLCCVVGDGVAGNGASRKRPMRHRNRQFSVL